MEIDNGSLIEGDGEVKDLEWAEQQLEEDDRERPFVMFRYHQEVDGVERVKTGLLYRRKSDGELTLADPPLGRLNPTRVLLTTMVELFFPEDKQPFAADEEIFSILREVLKAKGLDPHIFDGGELKG